MLDAQCSNKTQHISLLEALDEVEQDSTRSTCELVCLVKANAFASVVPIITTAHTGSVLVLCRLLNWCALARTGCPLMVADVKPESRQMSFLIRIRIGTTPSNKPD